MIERSLKLGEGLYITINPITEQFEHEITIHCWYLLILRHDDSKARAFYFAHRTRKVESRNPRRLAHVLYYWPELPGLLSRSWYNEWKGPTIIDNAAYSYWIPVELGPESTPPFLIAPYVWRILFNLIYTYTGGFLLWRGNDAQLLGYRFSSVFSYKNLPRLNKGGSLD